MEFDALPELGWKALKYAARRLPPPDVASFEDQLAEDQSAREAVAQAVELSHTVAILHAFGGGLNADNDHGRSSENERSGNVAQDRLAPRRQMSWQSIAMGISIGMAACLALVWVTAPWWTANPVANLTRNNEQVTSTWADLQNADQSSALQLLDQFATEKPTATEDTSLDAQNRGESGNLVPEWLMLGVEKDVAPE